MSTEINASQTYAAMWRVSEFLEHFLSTIDEEVREGGTDGIEITNLSTTVEGVVIKHTALMYRDIVTINTAALRLFRGDTFAGDEPEIDDGGDNGE